MGKRDKYNNMSLLISSWFRNNNIEYMKHFCKRLCDHGSPLVSYIPERFCEDCCLSRSNRYAQCFQRWLMKFSDDVLDNGCLFCTHPQKYQYFIKTGRHQKYYKISTHYYHCHFHSVGLKKTVQDYVAKIVNGKNAVKIQRFLQFLCIFPEHTTNTTLTALIQTMIPVCQSLKIDKVDLSVHNPHWWVSTYKHRIRTGQHIINAILKNPSSLQNEDIIRNVCVFTQFNVTLYAPSYKEELISSHENQTNDDDVMNTKDYNTMAMFLTGLYRKDDIQFVIPFAMNMLLFPTQNKMVKMAKKIHLKCEKCGGSNMDNHMIHFKDFLLDGGESSPLNFNKCFICQYPDLYAEYLSYNIPTPPSSYYLDVTVEADTIEIMMEEIIDGFMTNKNKPKRTTRKEVMEFLLFMSIFQDDTYSSRFTRLIHLLVPVCHKFNITKVELFTPTRIWWRTIFSDRIVNGSLHVNKLLTSKDKGWFQQPDRVHQYDDKINYTLNV